MYIHVNKYNIEQDLGEARKVGKDLRLDRTEGIRTSRYSVLEISVLNNKNNLIEFKNLFKFVLHVDVVYFGTE